MSVDVLRVVLSICNLIILYIIVKKYLFKPVDKVITDRENEIIEKINITNVNEEKSVKLLSENEELLKNSKEQGKVIVEDYKNKAEKVSTDIIEEAHKEANLIMERARTEADREKVKAKDEIKTQIVDLATLMSAKALGETIDINQHKKLINEFISKVGI